MKRVLITGAGGQLADELVKSAPLNTDVVAVSRDELDITDARKVAGYIDAHVPDSIINAAAYTAVDRAEQCEEDANKVNAEGVLNLANAAASDTYLLHISTDFVFDGRKNTPYGVDDTPNPQSVYGATKLLGEQYLFESKPQKSAVIRTAWVYSSHGGNFVNSMLSFMKQRDELNIVVDQVGTPTWTKGLAEVCWQACAQQIEGTFHWSDAGATSWYDFAECIQQLGLEYGMLEQPIRLNAIPTEQYPLPAPRPAYSVLDKSALLNALPNLRNTHWLAQLREMFKELESKS